MLLVAPVRAVDVFWSEATFVGAVRISSAASVPEEAIFLYTSTALKRSPE